MKHVPKHRAPQPTHLLVAAPRKALRTTLVMSSVAVATTGVTVGGGLLSSSPAAVTTAADLSGAVTLPDAARSSAPSDTASAPTSTPSSAGATTESDAAGQVTLPPRTPSLSRSLDRRPDAVPAKEQALSATSAAAVSGSRDLAAAAPRDIGRALLGEFGWGDDQFGCLDSLWTRESGWNIYADNPSSSAYGIPQALPGSKMASAGPDWADNPVTQIRWGLGYIADRYGSPCGAWGHSESNGWY